MLNLYKITKTFEKICLEHKLVNQFTYDDIYEHLNNNKSNKYGATHLLVDNINVNIQNDNQTINGTLFYVDRLMADESNKLDVQATAQRTLEEILLKLSEEYSWTFTTLTYTIFTEKFADLCAGCYVTFSVEVPTLMICSDDIFIPKSKILKQNGEYDVVGYDKVIIAVPGGIITEEGKAERYSGDVSGLLDGVTEIGDYAFYYSYYSNGGVTGELDLSKVTKIGENGLTNAFRGTNLSGEVAISSGCTLGQYALKDAFSSSKITKFSISQPITRVFNNDGWSLQYCSELVEIDLSGITMIDSYEMRGAFQNNTKLSIVRFDNLEQVDFYSLWSTFSGCSSLKVLRFPELKRFLGNSWFSGTNYIEELHFRADMQATIEAQSLYASKFRCPNATIYFDL